MQIAREDALLALLDSLYEEYGDDLPTALRFPIALIRHICAKASDDQLKDLRKATKEDVERAIEQSKLATEYAAQGLIAVTRLPDVFELVVEEEVDKVLSGIERLREDIGALTTAMTAEVADAEIDAAKLLLKSGHDHVALDRLQQLKTRKWPQLDGWHRFRVEANIGAIFEYRSDLPAAARQYLAAWGHHPTGEIPRCYEATAQAYLGDNEKAFELSTAVRRDHPESTFAAQIWVRTAPTTIQFADIEVDVPECLRGDAGVSCALARRALDSGLFAEAEVYLRLALKAAPESPDILHETAVVLIDTETRGRQLIRATEPFIDATGKLGEALEYLSRAIDRLGPSGPTRRLNSLRHNRALILELLGRSESARQDLERATQEVPEDQQLVLAYARHLIEHSTPDAAIAVLEPLSASAESPSEAALGLAHAYMLRKAEGDIDRATGVLQAHYARAPRRLETHHFHVVERILELLCFKGDLGAASEHLDGAKDELRAIEWHLLSAILAHKSDESLAQTEAMAALRLLDEESTEDEWESRYRVAEVLSLVGLDSEALPLWQHVSPPDCIGPLLYKLLECARRCEAYDVIRDHCKAIRDRGYVDEYCLGLELETLQRFNALNDVVDDLQAVVNSDPTHMLASEMRLWLSLAGLRLGRPDLIVADPAQLPAVDRVAIATGAAVVQVLHFAEHRDAAVDYAYNLFRRFPGEERAYQAVIFAGLFGGWGATRFETFDEVRADCAVAYTHEGSEDLEWRIIETEGEPAADLSRDELAPASALATRLLGSGRGDTIALTDAPSRSITIREIVDKRLFRGQKCLREFERRFPLSQFIRSVRVIDDTGEADLSPVMEILKAQDESAHRSVEVYLEIPACAVQMLAERLGGHVIETIQHIACTGGGEVKCAPGDSGARQRCIAHLQMSNAIVLDVTAITTLFLSNQVELIGKVPAEVLLSEGTLAELREFRGRWFGQPGTKATMRLVGGRLALHEWSDEERSKLQGAMDGLLTAIAESARIVGGFGVARLEAEKRDLMIRAFGQSTAEAMIVARDHNAMLWSDDNATSMYARHECGLEFAWTQSVGQWLHGQGTIDADTLHRLTVWLLGYKYWFTSIDANTVMFALAEAEWRHDYWPFTAISAHLCDPRIHIRDAYRILRGVIAPIWRDAPDRLTGERVLLGSSS